MFRAEVHWICLDWAGLKMALFSSDLKCVRMLIFQSSSICLKLFLCDLYISCVSQLHVAIKGKLLNGS